MTQRAALVRDEDGFVENVALIGLDPPALAGRTWLPASAWAGDASPQPGDTWLADSPATFMRPAPAETETTWLIDIGPFFDRFGLYKMAILSSANTFVQALVKNLTVRKWIDLRDPEIGHVIDLLFQVGVLSGDAASFKAQISGSAATAAENFALRKTYFGG